MSKGRRKEASHVNLWKLIPLCPAVPMTWSTCGSEASVELKAFRLSVGDIHALHRGRYQTKQHASEGQRVKCMKDCYPQLI